MVTEMVVLYITGWQGDWQLMWECALVPGILELIKSVAIARKWPKRWAKSMELYPLLLEMVRYIMLIIALFWLTSMLEKEKSFYAIAFCANFFLVLIVNTIANYDKK